MVFLGRYFGFKSTLGIKTDVFMAVQSNRSKKVILTFLNYFEIQNGRHFRLHAGSIFGVCGTSQRIYSFSNKDKLLL